MTFKKRTSNAKTNKIFYEVDAKSNVINTNENRHKNVTFSCDIWGKITKFIKCIGYGSRVKTVSAVKKTLEKQRKNYRNRLKIVRIVLKIIV